jgi:hypothetical protein
VIDLAHAARSNVLDHFITADLATRLDGHGVERCETDHLTTIDRSQAFSRCC